MSFVPGLAGMIFVVLGMPSMSTQEPLQVTVGQQEVCGGPGVLILIRKEGRYGALRITGSRAGSEPLTGSAEYESFFQSDGSGRFAGTRLRHRRGRVNEKPLAGIGRFDWQTGNTRLGVGPWSFPYSYPGCVGMWPYYGDQRDHGYQFAAVRDVGLDRINTLDPGITWFGWKENRRVQFKVP